MPPSPLATRPLWRRLLSHRAFWIVVALALAVTAGVWAWRSFYAAPDLRSQYVFATVQRGDIQDLVTATGTVQPRDYVDVGAQVSGQLKKLHVDVGSVVQAGDLLAEIDPTVLKATVDARRAGLRNQRATLAERQSQLVLANLLLSRQKNLMKDDATTTEALQQAEANARAAQAQIDATRASIEQTESTLRADEANLNYAKIYAPLAGTVVTVTARQGQTLNANQSAPTILRIADLSTMTVQTQVSEADVSKLRQGMEVYFTTLGSQGRRWYGTLRKVEPTPTVTNNVVLYNALFDVPNANQSLMTSMTAQVFFVAASAKNALVVPAAALSGGGRSADGAGRRERGAGGPGGSGAAGGASGGERNPPVTTGADNAASAALRVPGAMARAASAALPAAPADADRFAGMSREERRAAMEQMSPEEREAMRERRRAAGGGGPGGGRRDGNGGAGPGTATAGAGATAASDSPRPPTVTSSGFATDTPRAPRRTTVKLLTAAGTLEDRQVELGVSNRVQTQVLSGLAEGDQVVAGIKLPPSAAQTSGSPNPGGGLQQNPAGMPPGAGGGGPRTR